MKPETLTQVTLTNKNSELTTWIETEYANKGWLLSLKEIPGVWLVKEVYSTVTKTRFSDHYIASKHFRTQTDQKNKN